LQSPCASELRLRFSSTVVVSILALKKPLKVLNTYGESIMIG